MISPALLHPLILTVGVCTTLLVALIIKKFIIHKHRRKLQCNTDPPGNGNLERIRILNNDLTVKERALLKSNAKFQALFEYAPVMISSTDPSGIPDLWNKECTRVFGYTHKEIIGNPNTLELLYGKDADHVRKDVNKTSGKFIEYSPKTKAGRKVKTMWANMPLPDGSIISVGYSVERISPKISKLNRKKKVYSAKPPKNKGH